MRTTSKALRISARGLLVVVFLCCWSNFCRADWINLSGAENSPTIAEIYVERDHVKVNLEIYIHDVPLFRELIPNRLLNETATRNRPSDGERMRSFSTKKLTITDENGKKLLADSVVAEPRLRTTRPSPLAGMINPVTKMPVPGPPEDKRVLYVELIYPFGGIPPETLTFNPPMDENGIPNPAIGFVCYHEGVMVVDFRQLTANATLTLDWDDPWYSSFARKQLQRRLQPGVRTYLYIEPYEVRHEILVRVKDMMSWLEFDLQGNDYIEENEFDPVRRKIAAFFMERERLLIDGKRLKPILDRTAYVESSMLRSRFIEIPERVPLNTAMVGIIITYLTDGMPQEVEARWDLFSDRVQKVTASMIDPAGPFPYDLEPGDNVLKWTNYLNNYIIPTVENITVDERYRGRRIPFVSLICLLAMVPVGYGVVRRIGARRPVILPILMLIGLVGMAVAAYPLGHTRVGGAPRATGMDEKERAQLVLALLKNVYRAFDFRDEEDVYDKLAVSVSGDLLTNIYLQSRTSLEIEQAGGAQASVKQIDIIETSARESEKLSGALDVRAQWSATGTVGHWGHVHTRQNLYDAILTIAVEDGNWKINRLEVLEEKRVDPFSGKTR
jgi:hypothetical protein